jgi:hypothetical protein
MAIVFDLVQPSAWRREWELVRDGQVSGVLAMPMFRSGGSARAGAGSWRIENSGLLRRQVSVMDEASGAELARIRGREGAIGARSVHWKRLGRREGWGFVEPNGEVLAAVKLRSGLARTNGAIGVAGDLSELDAVLTALLAAYLRIRQNEEDASTIASTAG